MKPNALINLVLFFATTLLFYIMPIFDLRAQQTLPSFVVKPQPVLEGQPFTVDFYTLDPCPSESQYVSIIVRGQIVDLTYRDCPNNILTSSGYQKNIPFPALPAGSYDVIFLYRSPDGTVIQTQRRESFQVLTAAQAQTIFNLPINAIEWLVLGAVGIFAVAVSQLRNRTR